MDIKELIPKNKFDLDSVNDLAIRDPEEINLILPKLMEWLQDINWPVAQELSKVLPRCGEKLLPHIWSESYDKTIYKTSNYRSIL